MWRVQNVALKNADAHERRVSRDRRQIDLGSTQPKKASLERQMWQLRDENDPSGVY